jgi:hypothetical protein
MTCWKSVFTAALIVAGAAPSPSQSIAKVQVAYDFLESFPQGRVSQASECAVRRPATVGGVRQNGLFEHPRGVEQPARVDYAVDLPAIGGEDRLLLAFEIGLADGIQLGTGEDGVRFILEVDGHKLFSRECRECRWESHAVDLTSLAGRPLQIGFLIDALGNTRYDWAVWGRPRLLRFTRLKPAGDRVSPVNTGVVAFPYRAESKIKFRVKPSGPGQPVEWQAPAGTGLEWQALDFDFPQAGRAQVEWEPADALSPEQVWLGAYPAHLKLLRAGPGSALPEIGDTVPLRVDVVNDGRGKLAEGEARVELQVDNKSLPPQVLPSLSPDESWRGEWAWRASGVTGDHVIKAKLFSPDDSAEQTARLETFAHPGAGGGKVIENESLKLEFVRQRDGFAYANIFARDQGDWTRVGVWRPLMRVVSDSQHGPQDREIRPKTISLSRKRALAGPADSAEFAETVRDGDGVAWRARLRVELQANPSAARVHYEWQASAARAVRALWGPNLYIGEGTVGEAKSGALFPGIEYLHGPERSSNPRDFAPPLADRRTPHPHKVTVPLMAVTIGPNSQFPPATPARFFTPDSVKDSTRAAGPDRQAGIKTPKSELTVALFWDPLQKWDGEHRFPSARFASPNFDEGMSNHRLGLFLPSAPDFVPENGDRADRPYTLAAGKPVTLDALLAVTRGPATSALRAWLETVGGLPKPGPWPRSFQQELDVCRAGLLQTIWDAQSEKWRHCIGWSASHAPGFAALLWLDSRIAEKAEARSQSRARVELAAQNMLREGGPPQFASQANCHILQWEFPFLYGFLPEALSSLEGQIAGLIQSQQSDGGWPYQPGSAQQSELGQAGDSVLGTCAQRAATLLRYARITGDAAALAAGQKAARFMERFRVPRGGQTWECPMYEPDILAAGYAVRAYVEAWRASGDPRWLHDAVYWAESGVPFVYQWTLPERPMMLGATIPVFGSTFYTHTWLAVPVQWCGLVYACHVLHLADELQRAPLPRNDSPLPLALNFSPRDWRQIAELIAVSAMRQQYGDGERIGTYPDSISGFQQRNAPFLNPEDILVNVLTLQGHDPDVKSARIMRAAGDVVISSGAQIQKPRSVPEGLRFQIDFFPGENSHTLVVGLKPRAVRVNGAALPELKQPLRTQPGWWWDDKTERLFLTARHDQTSVAVEVEAR